MPSPWIDVSVPLRTGMVHWPDNPAVRIARVMDMDRGAHANVSVIEMGAHTGTHMDAPVHFLPDGDGMTAMPFEAVIGEARVVAIDDPECIREEHVAALDLREGDRVLFKTRNSPRVWTTDEFQTDFVYVTAPAARALVSRRVRTVGVDYLSVGGYRKDGRDTHRALLGAGIWIIEGLNLADVRPGRVELVCLPLKIAGGDGAPARAIVRELQPGGEGVASMPPPPQ